MPADFYGVVLAYIICTGLLLLPWPIAAIIVSRATKTRLLLPFPFYWYVLLCLLALEIGMYFGAATLLRVLPSWLFQKVIQAFYIITGTGLPIIYVKDFIAPRLLSQLKRKRDSDK